MTDPKHAEVIESGFERLLHELEASLETPVVPGELSTWIEAVEDATKSVANLLQQQLHNAHQKQFEEIVAEDEDMTARVEQLKDEDDELSTDFQRFSRSVEGLRKLAVDAERNETELEKAQEALVEKGLAFVIRARTQETAIATWYSEAFLRDRGVGD